MYILLLFSHFSCVQLFVTPMDCSPPGSSVHEILQVGIPEWVAISFSRASSQPPQGSDLSLLHCRQILDHLSHQGSPKDCYYHLWDHLIFCPKWAARTHSFQSQHFKDNKPCKSLSWTQPTLSRHRCSVAWKRSDPKKMNQNTTCLLLKSQIVGTRDSFLVSYVDLYAKPGIYFA